MKKLFQNKKLAALLIALLSLLLAAAVIIPLLAFPSAAGEPTVTIKLNSVVQDIDNPIAVLSGDRIELRLDFQNIDAGNIYSLTLPDIFLRLDHGTIQMGNAAIMQYIDFKIDYNPTTKKQMLTITFNENVLAASFTFVGTLNFSSSVYDVEKTIESEGSLDITLLPQAAPASSGNGVRSKPAAATVNVYKSNLPGNNTITNKQFMEDASYAHSYGFYFHINRMQLKQDIVGTATDKIPAGMRLFFPNAPNAAYYNDFAHAFRSFYIRIYDAFFKKDGAYNGDYTSGYSMGWHVDGDHSFVGTKTNITNYINNQEAAMGRYASYEKDTDIDWRINITDSMAGSMDNGQGKPVTYSSINVGYRLESDGKIHLYVVNTGGSSYSAPYEFNRTDPWSNTSNEKCIPICSTYDPGDISECDVMDINISTTNDPNEHLVLQTPHTNAVASGFTRTQRVPYEETLPDGRKTYQWIYSRGDEVMFKVNLIRDDAAGTETIEVDMDITEGHYLYGKCLFIGYYVYFDRDNIVIPSDGKKSFVNKVSFITEEYSTTANYNYDFGSMGAVITGAAKTVENTKKTYLNPEAEDTAQTYALIFAKDGTLDIAANNLNVFDILDSHLEYVSDSIKIYKETAANVWTDVTTSSGATTAQAVGGEASDLNLKVDYVPHQTGDKITITNTGQLAFSGKIKVEFDAKLKEGTAYGTKVPNYFGETVTTLVDNKFALRKVNESGAVINSPATFSVEYTTVSNNGFDFDLDYEYAALANLKTPDDNTITTLTTSSGIAQTLYRLDADKFYLKLVEVNEPEGYVKLTQPIWIKAERNSGTNEMQYSLAKAPAGVSISIGSNGLLTIQVKNTLITREVVIPGRKIVEGDNPPDEIFRFELKQVANDRGGEYTQGDPIQREAEIKGGGEFTFPPIPGLTAGVYYFTIEEKPGNLADWDYDRTVYLVTVTVGGSPLTYKTQCKVLRPGQGQPVVPS